MPDEIIFLGSGGGRVVFANQFVGTGGFVVKIGGYQIWVDPGEGALVRARGKVKATNTNIVYVTHNHPDHATDTNAVVDAMTIGGERKRGILISTQATINGSENENPTLSKFHKNALKEVYAIKPGDKVKVGPLTFEATQTKHEVETIGLKIRTPDRVIGYTSDTELFPELTKIFEGCDVLIANVLRPGKEKWPGHFCSEDAAEFFRATRPKLGVISHFGAKMLKANPVWEAREIGKRSNTKVYAAREGMKIDLKTLFVS